MRHEHVQSVLAVRPGPQGLTAWVEALPSDLASALDDNALSVDELQQVCTAVAQALEFLVVHGLCFDNVKLADVGLTPQRTARLCALDLVPLPRTTSPTEAEAKVCCGYGALLHAIIAKSAELRCGSGGLEALAAGCCSGAVRRMGDVVVQRAVSSGCWELRWDQLTFVKLLGAGQFGEVQLMREARSQKLVAVKTLINAVGLRGSALTCEHRC